MTEVENRCGEIKATLQKLTDVKVSPTARLVAVLMTCGITDNSELASLVGRSVRMVQVARNELRETHCAGTQPIAPNATHFAKPIAESETHCASEPRAHARIELPSGVLPSKVVKKDTPPPPKGPGKAECLEAFNLYNETALRCAIPQAAKFTPERQRKIAARLKVYGMDGWRRALANIEKSSFLTGGTAHAFRADLDFVLQDKSFGRLHDGGYGNGRHAKAPVAVRMAKTESQIAAENEAMLREYGLHPECNA